MSFVPFRFRTYYLHLNFAVQYEKSNKNRTPNNDDKNGAKSKIRRAYLRDKKAPKPPLSGN